MSPARSTSDGAALALFALLAVAHVAGRSQGVRPFHMLTGDAALYASVAAARDHPHLFAGDGLLADPRDTGFLVLAQIPLVRLAARLTGDYGSGSVLLLGPHVFLQLAGFYVLGRCLFGSRFWALLLALLAAPYRGAGIGEYWGLNHDVQPRFTFQALWPFFLAAALRLSAVPRAWPWLLAAVGPLAFVHPVSAPALAASLWLGFLPVLPAEWPTALKGRHMLVTGAAFVIGLVPYLVVYARTHVHGAAGPEVSEALALVGAGAEHAFVASFGAALLAFGADMRGAWPYLAAAAAGAILLWREHRLRATASMVLLWAAGLAVAGVAIPGALQARSRWTGALPLDTQLVRSLRYLLPVALIVLVWSMAHWSRRWGTRTGLRRFAPAALGIAVTAVWWWQHPVGPLRPGLRCWASGRFYCPPRPPHEATVGIEAVRRLVPEGARLVATRYERQIRYAALRPVVYAERDGDHLPYSNHQALLEWARKHREMRWIHARGTRRAKLGALSAFARRNGAGYVFVNFPVAPRLLDGLPLQAVWAGEHFALLRVSAPARAPA